jgi:hypothetical protein
MAIMGSKDYFLVEKIEMILLIFFIFYFFVNSYGTPQAFAFKRC